MEVLYEVLYDLASCAALWMAWVCVSLRFSVPCPAPALAADAAVCLALAAHAARRRGRCSVPVEGVLLSRRVTPSWETQTWRYLWDGTSLAVTDVASTFMFLPGFREGNAAILWVDPSRPLRCPRAGGVASSSTASWRPSASPSRPSWPRPARAGSRGEPWTLPRSPGGATMACEIGRAHV